jgi:valyl-tRNA synthetase
MAGSPFKPKSNTKLVKGLIKDDVPSLGDSISSNFQSSDSDGFHGIAIGISDIESEIVSQSESEKGEAKSNFANLRNAIQMLNMEAKKVEEIYANENSLLSKANQQLVKLSKMVQQQDAELAAAEEELRREQRHRESAERHFIKLKKMMVVKDVEVTEAEQQKKAEQKQRRGAEKEIALLRKQLQAKGSLIAATEKRFQKECQRREKCQNQLMEIAKRAGKQSAEKQYQILEQLRIEDERQKHYDSSQDDSTSSVCSESSTKENR